MINNFSDEKKDRKTFAILAVIVVFMLWFFISPSARFSQFLYCGNNIKHFFSKLFSQSSVLDDYEFYKKNAKYLAGMNSAKRALVEIDKAINCMPTSVSDSEVDNMYKNRAAIKLYLANYKGALDDLTKVSQPTIDDLFKIALLFKTNGNNRKALSYCNKIFEKDLYAYSAYACVADIYAGVGRNESSVMIYDLLIDRSPNKARYYADRAFYKRLYGDKKGAEKDIAKARELSPGISEDVVIIKEALHPDKINLSI